MTIRNEDHQMRRSEKHGEVRPINTTTVSVVFVLAGSILLTAVGQIPAARAATTPGDNPSVNEDVAKIVVTSVILAIATADKSSAGSNPTGQQRPVVLPSAIAIPGKRPLVTLGETKFTGPIVPESADLQVLSVGRTKQRLAISGGILTGKVALPAIDYGPVIETRIGHLIGHGPVEFLELQIAGPIVAPAASVGATTISGTSIVGKVTVHGPITLSHSPDLKSQVITISGPITLEGPVTILSISYGPFTDGNWGPLLNPGPITVQGPVTIAGPIIIRGAITND